MWLNIKNYLSNILYKINGNRECGKKIFFLKLTLRYFMNLFCESMGYIFNNERSP